MTLKNVTILGGTGFVGSTLTVDLAQHCEKVTVLTRREQRCRELRILSNVHIKEMNVHDEAALREAIDGSDAVINLIGILNQSGNDGTNTFTGAHADLTRKVVDAVKQTGVAHYLHMSALNADAENGGSQYLKSKGEAEKHIDTLAGSATQTTIFRPSVIFGEDDSFFNRFAGLLQIMPFMPLACPESKMSPVYVGDISDVMCASLGLHDMPEGVEIVDKGKGISTIDMCGPRDYTLRELVQFTADTMGIKRTIIGLPDWAARLQGKIMGILPATPFSTDNYLSLQTDSVCESDNCRRPTSIEAIVPRYLGSTGHRDVQQSYRRYARR